MRTMRRRGIPSKWPLGGDHFTRLKAGVDPDVRCVLQSSRDRLPGPTVAILDKHEALTVLGEYGRARRQQYVALASHQDIGAAGQVGQEPRIAAADAKTDRDLTDVPGAETRLLRHRAYTHDGTANVEVRMSIETRPAPAYPGAAARHRSDWRCHSTPSSPHRRHKGSGKKTPARHRVPGRRTCVRTNWEPGG